MTSSTTFLSTIVLFTAATLAFTATSVVAAAELIEIDNWYLPYSGPKEVEANVGDTIIFKWNTGHNVYVHPTMDCGLDGQIFVGDRSPTEYTFTDADGSLEGTNMFFACDIGNGGHCRAGQNLIVTVYSDDGGLSGEDLTTDIPITIPPTSGATVPTSSEATDMNTSDGTDSTTDTPSDAPIEFEDASNITDIIFDDDFGNATDGNATDAPSFDTDAIIVSSTCSHQNSVVTIAIGLLGAAAVILLF